MFRKLTLAAFAVMLATAGVVVTPSTASAQGGNVVVISGDITSNIRLRRKKTYVLDGPVFVRSGAKVKIDAGTRIVAAERSFLVVDKGAKLLAKGTAERPIVFTSAQPAGQRRRGDWGGIIINGNAPVNCAATPGGECIGEGDTGNYGGDNPADNSGNLRYVRVEYGGFAISPDNELNCIAFQGVGNKTKVDFVQALNGGDDGMEWFGGTMDAKHLVVIGASDDSIDWTDGWVGRVQFAVVQQRGDEADAGMECDNNAENNNLEPRSNPFFANVTLVGDPDPDNGPGSTRAIRLRAGTWANLRNFVVIGFKNVGLQIETDATIAGFTNGQAEIQGFIFHDNKGGDNIASGASEEIASASAKVADQVNPQLVNPFNYTSPDFRPAAGSPALDPANVAPKFNDAFFVEANYVGAFSQTDNWLAGWTNFEVAVPAFN